MTADPLHRFRPSVSTPSPDLPERQPIAGDQALPVHPAVVDRSFANGLRVLVRPHQRPPHRCVFGLRVAAGSLHENDDERGYAHFVEHLAFSGSEHFPPGSVIPSFEKLGLEFGRDQNAYTSFEQTVYTLDLPHVEEATLDLAFRFLTDVAGRLLLPDDAVENERRVILEERRTGLGPGMRLMQQLWPQLLPGARLSERLPIGTEETLAAASAETLRAFYRRWYRPDRMTLVVVGDVDPAIILGLVERTLAELPAATDPMPEEPPSGISYFTEPRAAVASDPEVRTCDLEISCIDAARPPRATVATFDHELRLALGGQALNLRLARLISEGVAPFRSAGFSTSSLFRQAQWSGVNASCEAPRWRDALTLLSQTLRAARDHGFTDRELQAMIRQIRRNAEAAVEAEQTVPAGSIAAMLLDDVNQRRPHLSSVQHLELLDQLLPEVTADGVTAAFRQAFAVERAAYVVIAPTSNGDDGAALRVGTPDGPMGTSREGAPLGRKLANAIVDRAEVAAAIPQFIEGELPAVVEQHAIEGLMPEVPAAAAAASREVVDDLEVTTVTFGNGVIMHHKFNDFQKDAVQVVITVGGGVIDEGEDNRGITELAVSGLNQPSTSRLSSADIRELVLGHTFAFSVDAVQDHLALQLSATPRDLEVGLQLAHLLMVDARIEASAFDHTVLGLKEQFEEEQFDPVMQVARVVSELTTSDPRNRALTAEDLDRLDRATTEEWLRSLLAGGPVEVTVVGDIDQAIAESLIARYLGSLPPRRERFADVRARRSVAIRPGPYHDRRTYPTQEPVAYVLFGFRSTDLSEMAACRHLRVAARILSTRLIQQIRDRMQLVYGIEALNRPSEVHPDLGFFGAGSFCDPAASSRLLGAIEEMFGAMATDGPTNDEIEVAIRQIDTKLRDDVQTPGYWLAWLGAFVARGRQWDDLRNHRANYRHITAETVRTTFARFFTEERRLQIEVLPDVVPPPTDDAGECESEGTGEGAPA